MVVTPVFIIKETILQDLKWDKVELFLKKQITIAQLKTALGC